MPDRKRKSVSSLCPRPRASIDLLTRDHHGRETKKIIHARTRVRVSRPRGSQGDDPRIHREGERRNNYQAEARASPLVPEADSYYSTLLVGKEGLP